MSKNFKHIPVMLTEILDALQTEKGGIYVDGTLGGGGHTEEILKLGGRVIGIDQDTEALAAAKERLVGYGEKITYVHDNFRSLANILDEVGIDKVGGILLDLGVSSHQLDSPERGFSFNETEENLGVRLDMRMDTEKDLSAYEVVNEYSEKDLSDILFKYGGEPFARSIAHKIILRRGDAPIETIGNLLSALKTALPPKVRYGKRHGHYADKTFQAIRIEVNQELKVLEEVIPQAMERLKVGGRLAIITFHSLEDRIVKHTFREMAANDEAKLITRKPIVPSEEEITENPRSKSAKLRVAEKA